jgi:hypothetical protein
MSSKQLCIIFVGVVIASALINLNFYFERRFVSHPITGFYYYSSYLILSSFHHVVQHR